MGKSITYVIKTKVVRNDSDYTDKYQITVEGSGFVGEGKSIFLGQAFEKAYEDLMSKVSAAIFTEE